MKTAQGQKLKSRERAPANTLVRWIDRQNMIFSKIVTDWLCAARTATTLRGTHAAQRAALNAELDDWRAEMRRRAFRAKRYGARLGQHESGGDQLGEL